MRNNFPLLKPIVKIDEGIGICAFTIVAKDVEPWMDVTCRPTRLIICGGVWIAVGAKILPRVTINEISVVGAGSVETKDVEGFIWWSAVIMSKSIKYLEMMES